MSKLPPKLEELEKGPILYLHADGSFRDYPPTTKKRENGIYKATTGTWGRKE